MSKDLLVGTWKLLSFEVKLKDGEIIYPLGKEAVGYLIYSMDDYMSVALMSANRPECSTNNFIGVTTDEVTTNEKLEIASNYIGYLGRYEVVNDMVNYYLEVSPFPNFTNVKLARKYELKDNQLILASPSHPNEEKEMSFRAVFERI